MNEQRGQAPSGATARVGAGLLHHSRIAATRTCRRGFEGPGALTGGRCGWGYIWVVPVLAPAAPAIFLFGPGKGVGRGEGVSHGRVESAHGRWTVDCGYYLNLNYLWKRGRKMVAEGRVYRMPRTRTGSDGFSIAGQEIPSRGYGSEALDGGG